MKIVATSDLHGVFPTDLPKGDILTISGDIIPSLGHNINRQEGWVNTVFIPWVQDKAENIIFCAGNHDFFFEHLMKTSTEDKFRKSLPKNVHYLRDSDVNIGGYKFYGTPWCNVFGNWPFMQHENELIDTYSNIPNNCDIVLSHGPAYGYGDMIEQFHETEHLGSKALTNRLKEVKCKWCLTGHIHSGSHKFKKLAYGDIVVENRTRLVCVSLLDEGYEIAYKPYEIEI